jgi:hypothetical protein
VEGVSYGTTNVIVPLAVPLLVTPLLYAFPVPVELTVLIQNGCPVAFTLKVYVCPSVKVNVGSDCPFIK